MKIGILEDRMSYAVDLKKLLESEIPAVEVLMFHSVDKAVASLETESVVDWDLWIVDLMMSPGKLMDAASTSNGLATGTRFIEEICNGSCSVRKGVIVITSRNTDDDRFEDLDLPIVECQKAEYTQVEIARMAAKIVG